MKKKCFFIRIILLLAAFSIVVALVVRFSLVDDIDFNANIIQLNDYRVTYYDGEEENIELFDKNIDSFEKLKEASQFILRVKLSGSRQQLYGTVLSEVEVLDTYKSDSIGIGDKIYI